ncbi:MAG: glycosyltransferase family 39 protein [Gemmatimonadota bacterium]|nr:glycosyltransferase family 39 protein [Gemmatimonadota bacterium]
MSGGRRTVRSTLGGLGRAARSEPALFGYAAVFLYALGIGWGLPHATGPERMFPWGPDELAPLRSLGELYRLFGPADAAFAPQYPMMQYFVQALFAAPYAAWLLLTGGLEGLAGTYPFGLADPAGSLAVFTVLARIPTVLMGGGTVAAAWWTADRLWGRRAARFAALAVLLSLPMFYYGRTSNVDVPALFWLACGTAAFAAALRDGLTVRRGALLGLFAALSVATKDAGYAYFAGVAVAVLGLQALAVRRGDAAVREAAVPLLAGAGAAAAVYAVASGLVFSIDRFIAHVGFLIHGTPLPEGVEHPYYYTGEASLRGYLALAGTTARHVVDSLGLPLAIAALGGVFLTMRENPRLAWLLLPPVTVFLGTIVPVRFVLIRFVLPIAYVFALFAGAALAALVHRLREGVWARRAAGLAVLVCLGWAGARAADLTVQMWTDSRYALGDWLARTLDAGDEVGYYGSSVKLPHLPAVVEIGAMPGQILPPDPGQSVARDPDVVLVIPQQDNEPVHEWTLRTEDFDRLVEGTAGYRQAYRDPGGGLLTGRIIPFVNPPVRAFVPVTDSGR